MKQITFDRIKEIKKERKKLEKTLGVRITTNEKNVIIDGSGDKEYIAEKVLDAIDFGFSVDNALLIRKEDAIFEILDIKNYTRKKDLYRIRARIIGTKGKTIKTLSQLTNCHLEVKENRIGVIGSPELIKNAQNALILIIQGSKQANVYAFLERNQVKPVFDLGLKEEKSERKGRIKDKE
jgi:KH domain-containing protein